jgi:hypothetical protein
VAEAPVRNKARFLNKPRRFARPLPDIAGSLLAESFRKQGFASSELVVRWAAIVGDDVAQYAEPLKIQWPRGPEGRQPEPGTLVLRVAGPAAIEIQHLSGVILERVNRYFGFAAIAKIAIRQAPLRPAPVRPDRSLDPQAVERIAGTLPDSADPALKDALARLGAAIKGK